MNRSNVKTFLSGLLFSAALSVTACKGKAKETTNENTTIAPTTTTEPAPAPVTITADDPLKQGVKDATKDFPGVNAEVNNGEITLTGDVERSKLPTLMQSLNSLRPKKINNNLNIK